MHWSSDGPIAWHALWSACVLLTISIAMLMEVPMDEDSRICLLVLLCVDLGSD